VGKSTGKIRKGPNLQLQKAILQVKIYLILVGWWWLILVLLLLTAIRSLLTSSTTSQIPSKSTKVKALPSWIVSAQLPSTLKLNRKPQGKTVWNQPSEGPPKARARNAFTNITKSTL